MQVPSIWVISQANPFGFAMGTRFRRLDDGYERMVVDEKGQFLHFAGLVYPHKTLAPFLTAVLKNGIDHGAARQDRRRAMAARGMY